MQQEHRAPALPTPQVTTPPEDSAPVLVDWQVLSNAWASFASHMTRQTVAYTWDAWERSVLYLDILRERGNRCLAHSKQTAPHVLNYEYELVMSGAELERPVNYGLVRVVPPSGIAIEPGRRPFIVVDPRAGHGPGIGGMKHDSEIGVALAAGHPCYFIGFLPTPVSGQTVEDVCMAEAQFLRKVIELHPDAEGKPFLIGNCQAGWQIAMMASMNPDLPGPLMLAGSPLSYWAGVRGQNVMRYLGGLLGGTWATSLAGDLGHGIFDGAFLISNFEALDPANTYWKKPYNVYSKVDTERPRYLDFETWWGNPVLLTAAEMQSIADNLFVGNRLAAGEICTSSGEVVDLRNIASPIIVFCSFGDNITPPQQALDWILDLYADDAELSRSGQTIVYALHDTIGHLGIFVSARVATKEHREIQGVVDLIDMLPPGLYEAVFERKTEDTAHQELVFGDYIVRIEPRTLADIRGLGTNSHEDNLRFATVARISEITQGIYRSGFGPVVRSFIGEQTAESLRQLHPYRLRHEVFSDRNPLLHRLADLAGYVQENRHAVDSSNLLMWLEHGMSEQIARWLDLYRDLRDSTLESCFLAIYGMSYLQALVGLQSDSAITRSRVAARASGGVSPGTLTQETESRCERGGLGEATVRALVYIGLGRDLPAFDERSFAVLREIRANTPKENRMPLATFKKIVREQYALLRGDSDTAMAALPKLLPHDTESRRRAFDHIRRIVAARGEPAGEVKTRLEKIEEMFTPPLPPRPVPESTAQRVGAKRAVPEPDKD